MMSSTASSALSFFNDSDLASFCADDLTVGSLDLGLFDNEAFPLELDSSSQVPSSLSQPSSVTLNTTSTVPRMVSTENMRSPRPVHKSAPEETPFDSLKKLVQKKQANTLPSSFLRQALSKTKSGNSSLQASRPTKKRKQAAEPAQQSPATTTTPPIPTGRYRFHIKSDNKYKYPLNQAIQRKANSEDLCGMINDAPTVLAVQDGKRLETPLCILLRTKPNDIATLYKMLSKYPDCVSTVDRHYNTPLHIACQNGASSDVVGRLCTIYPAALNMRNFHGKTPLEVAQHSRACSDEVAALLLKMYQQNEACL